jgi:antitoxin component YwqK of YwqJK toxin-antitoxin module
MKIIFYILFATSISACKSVEIKETDYYCNRNIKEVRHYKDNLFKYNSYFENGQPKSQYTLKDSLYHEEFKLFSDNGDLVMYCKFDSGKPITDLIGVKTNGDTIYKTDKNDSKIYIIFGQQRLKKQ